MWRQTAWLMAAAIALGCGARSQMKLPSERAADGGSTGGSSNTGGQGGAGNSGGEGGNEPPPPPPPQCLPPPSSCGALTFWEVFDLSGYQPAVVQDIAVVSSGEVLVGGYFGLLRRPDDSSPFTLISAPPVVASSFLQLVGGPGGQLWAQAFEETFMSPDAGSSWVDLADPKIAKVFPLSQGLLLVGGESTVGVLASAAGPVTWSATIEVLEGDTPTIYENNEVADVERVGDRFMAAERFGRVAIAFDPMGPWSAAGRLGEDPELIALDDQRVLAISGSGSVHIRCTPEGDWQWLADANPLTAAHFDTTRAARFDDGSIVAVANDGVQRSCDDGQRWSFYETVDEEPTYGLAVAPDAVWLAGFVHAYRVSW